MMLDRTHCTNIFYKPDFSYGCGTYGMFLIRLTGGQINNVTIVDTTSCAVNVLQTLYNNGSRNFLFQNVCLFPLPLPLTR